MILTQAGFLTNSSSQSPRGRRAAHTGFATLDDPPPQTSNRPRGEKAVPVRKPQAEIPPSTASPKVTPTRLVSQKPMAPPPFPHRAARGPEPPRRSSSHMQHAVRRMSTSSIMRAASLDSLPIAVLPPSPLKRGSKTAEPCAESIVIEGKRATCAGYLKKYSLRSSFAKAWRKRYFVLVDNVLRYFDDHSLAEDTTGKRSIIIAPSTQISLEVALTSKVKYLILIEDHTLEIELLLGTNSEEDKDKWMQKLSNIYGARKQLNPV